MYLSRLILNPRHRAVQRDVADCHALHRRIMGAFPIVPEQDARAHLGVLYRLDTHPRTGELILLVQSRIAPDWADLPAEYLRDTGGDPPNPASKQIDAAYGTLTAGTRLAFRLLANPTRRVRENSPMETHGAYKKRVDLRNDEARLDWLRRKADQSGFALLRVRTATTVPDVRLAPAGKVTGRQRLDDGSRTLTLAGVLFEGALEITDADRFRAALEQGIGPGKAYGLGLLSIGPLRGV